MCVYSRRAIISNTSGRRLADDVHLRSLSNKTKPRTRANASDLNLWFRSGRPVSGPLSSGARERLDSCVSHVSN